MLAADVDKVSDDIVGPRGLDVDLVTDLAGESLPQDEARYSGDVGGLQPGEAEFLHRASGGVVHQRGGVRALNGHEAITGPDVLEVAVLDHVAQPALDLVRRDHVRVLRHPRDQRILDDLSVLTYQHRVHRLADLNVGEVLPRLDEPHERVHIRTRHVELADRTPVTDRHRLTELKRLPVPAHVLVHDQERAPLRPLLGLAGQLHLPRAGDEEHGSLRPQRKVRSQGMSIPVLVVGPSVAFCFQHGLLTPSS